ncbi:MAG: carboxypeptidase-like regulatory domain-containing protein, partial [Nitrososphaerota archaeon]
MKDKKTTIISLTLAIILGLQLSSVFIGANLVQGADTEYEISLLVSDSEDEIGFRGLNVAVYDSDKKLVASSVSNQSGYVTLRLRSGAYFVSVQKGKRLVGYQEINVTKPEIFVVRTWSYDINVTCVDLENKPLKDHVVLLYDQLIFYAPNNFTTVANKTDMLSNWTRTDENGTALFDDVWNGTYLIRVVGGEVIGEYLLNLQASEAITIIGNKTYMMLRVLTASGEPLENARVFIQNSLGRLIFRDQTDKNGCVLHEGMYLDNYTVFVEWASTQVWAGTLNLRENRETTIRCSVYRLSLRFVDQFGNALPRA